MCSRRHFTCLRKWALLIAPLLTVVLIASFLVALYSNDLQKIADWFRDNKPVSVIVFLALYSCLMAFCVPKLASTVIAGYCFGFPVAFLITTIGIMIALWIAVGNVRLILPMCSCCVKRKKSSPKE